MTPKTYRGKDIDVTFELKRCIHAAECGRRLQVVFDTAKRPWVQPDNAAADEVKAAIDHCPSGALKYERHDGGAPEQTPAENIVLVMDSGEYQVRGDVQLLTMGGETVAEEYRMTLCRCGESNNKPFCDNTHRKARFVAPSAVEDNLSDSAEFQPNGALKIITAPNGPLLLQGNFEIRDATGEHIFQGRKAALCRCGGSANKPFCDGTHKENGFSAE
ncbi:MAG: CDGSH iron-sulfur domain-containing protein [Chloroflexota bacterium]